MKEACKSSLSFVLVALSVAVWAAPAMAEIEDSSIQAMEWRNIGLEDSLYIARVRIQPDNPELVYEASQ